MIQNLTEILTRGVEAIYPSRQAFENARKTKKLRIYNGIDPTAPSLHLGHLVVLRKLAQFQNLGHKIILLIGDFTARIGDPSGKLQARKLLTKAEVLKNAANYQEQARKVLKFTGTNSAEVKFNSQWLSKLSFEEVLKLMANFTAQQLLERDMFQARIKAKNPINFAELIYPLLQGYDSVALEVDAEIGGTDQTFNMLVGRELVKKYLKKEKFVITVKLLTVGETKMGKTESVFVPLSLPPHDMFGKIMALPDNAMPSFFELLTDINYNQVLQLQPIDRKKLLATEILKQLYKADEVKVAKEKFEKLFQKGELSETLEIFRPKAKSYRFMDFLVEANLVKSKAEAKRLINQGAVEVNQVKVKNPQEPLEVKDGIVVRVGKHRFVQLKVSN